MPIVPDPDRPRGRLLLDAAGDAVASFVIEQREDRRVADLFERAGGVTPERAAALVMAELTGWRVAADAALGHALVAAGATIWRDAHAYSFALDAPPPPASPPPPGVEIGPLERPAADLLDAYRAAFGPDHADWRHHAPPDMATDLEQLLRGPLLQCSRQATAGERAIGALLIGDIPGEPPFGGPWVITVFRDPDPAWRGTGRAMLEAGLHDAYEAGLPALGLAVSEGNPAERIYRALGFAHTLSSVSVDVP